MLICQQLARALPPANLLSVEAEKAVLDLEAPLAGTIVDVHQELSDKPALLDETDHNQNWVVTVSTK